MIKSIKFRVWGVQEKKFISDEYLAISLDGSLIWRRICYSVDEDDFWDDSWTEELNDKEYIVQQYTGLQDSTGKEIYEGDILAYKEGNFLKGENGLDDRLEIFWDAKNAKFGINFYSKYRGEGYSGKGEHLSSYSKKTEIIGNIFETPEFLQ